MEGKDLKTNEHLYKGISFPFRFNSKGGVATSELTHSDYSRIIESIHQIILTFKMERIMNLEFGVMRDFVFSSGGDLTERSLLKHNIKKAIDTHEKRVVVNSVEVFDHPEEGSIIVELDLHIIKFVKDVTIRTTFESFTEF